MVAVGMREEHHVQLLVPEGQRFAQVLLDNVAVGPAVDEELLTVGRADEDRVALTDVEHFNVQPVTGRGEDAGQAVRRREDGHPGEERQTTGPARRAGTKPRGRAGEGCRRRRVARAAARSLRRAVDGSAASRGQPSGHRGGASPMLKRRTSREAKGRSARRRTIAIM